MSAYGASKGGVAALTYCWAMDLADTGVRVNALSPVGTTRLRDHFREYLGEAYRPRPGPAPEDNAGVAAYLLSRASAPLTGQVVRISGRELGLMTPSGGAASDAGGRAVDVRGGPRGVRP